MQELIGQPLDLRRHGGGEEQRLASEGQQLDDLFDVGDEAHVEHAVGLVDDQHLDGVEQQLAALDVIEQAPRRGDDDIRAPVDDAVLFGEGNTADEQGDVDLVILAELLEGVHHLGGQLAGGLQYQGARHAGARPAALQAGQHGQGESRRLA